MHKIFLIFTYLISLNSFGQTKQETVDWLNSKLDGEHITKTSLSQLMTKIEIKANGNFVINMYEWRADEPNPTIKKENYVLHSIYRGNFKDFNPTSVSTRVERNFIYFYAHCTKGNCMIGTTEYFDPSQTFFNDQSGLLMGITLEYENLEVRVKKAFIHLIKLCGGATETF